MTIFYRNTVLMSKNLIQKNELSDILAIFCIISSEKRPFSTLKFLKYATYVTQFSARYVQLSVYNIDGAADSWYN